MHHVNAQGVDERMINVHYYYYCYDDDDDGDDCFLACASGRVKCRHFVNVLLHYINC